MTDSRMTYDRMVLLRTVAAGVTLLLIVRVLLSIVWEYRFYFPPNFNADFLLGREETFRGMYRTAFYAHIAVGPLAIVGSLFLMVSGIRGWKPKLHRRIGQAVMWIVIALVAPSGLVMATETQAGRVAALAFALLAVLTGATAGMALLHARKGNWEKHRRWAVRCFLLLCSPLLLRLVGGVQSVLQIESSLYYTFNAWLSWLLPLLVFEIVSVASSRRVAGGNGDCKSP